MAAEIFLWQIKTNGPSRQQASLVRKTRNLRHFPGGLAAVRRVGADFPPNVTGEQLASLAGSRLSILLQGEEPLSVSTWNEEHSGLSELPAPPQPRQRLQNLERSPATLHGADRPSSVMQAAPRAQPSFPAFSNRAKKGKTSDPRPPLHQPTTRPTLEQPVVDHEPRHDSLSSKPVLRRAGPRSLLEHKLAEYFNTSSSMILPPARPESSPAPAPAPAFLVGKAVPSGTPGPATPQISPSAGRSWPELSTQKLADQLNRFVSGKAAPSDSMQTAEFSEGIGPIEVQNIFHIQVNPQAGDAASWQDLSVQIADILREQAIQHGIDIT